MTHLSLTPQEKLASLNVMICFKYHKAWTFSEALKQMGANIAAWFSKDDVINGMPILFSLLTENYLRPEQLTNYLSQRTELFECIYKLEPYARVSALNQAMREDQLLRQFLMLQDKQTKTSASRNEFEIAKQVLLQTEIEVYKLHLNEPWFNQLEPALKKLKTFFYWCNSLQYKLMLLAKYDANTIHCINAFQQKALEFLKENTKTEATPSITTVSMFSPIPLDDPNDIYEKNKLIKKLSATIFSREHLNRGASKEHIQTFEKLYLSRLSKLNPFARKVGPQVERNNYFGYQV